MGFGNAAGSFMTGFMAGYKFIDDAEKRKAEIEALNKKAETELNEKKATAAKNLGDLRLSVINDNNKANQEFIKEKDKITNPEEWVNTYSKLELDANERRRTYNNLAINFASTFKDDSLKKDIFADAPIQTLKVVQSKDGQKYIMNPSVSPLMEDFYTDYKNPETQRTYSIDEKGYLKLNGKYIDGGGNPTNSNTPDNNTAKFQPASSFMSSSNEKITSFTPFPVTAMSEEERKYFEKYPIVTYGDINSYRQAKTGAKFFDAQVLYKDGKEISVSNKDDLDKMLQEGWSKQPPEKPTTGSIEAQQYKQYQASGGTKTFIEWKAGLQEQGKFATVSGAIDSKNIIDSGGKVNDAPRQQFVAMKEMDPKSREMVSQFVNSVNSYKTMVKQLNTLDKLITAKKYTSDVFTNIKDGIAQVAPSQLMSIFGDKDNLISKYGINADIAGTTADIIKAASGLTVNEGERKQYIEMIIGGLNSNQEVRRAAFKKFTESYGEKLNLEADVIGNLGAIQSYQDWNTYYRQPRNYIKGGEQTSTQQKKVTNKWNNIKYTQGLYK